VAQPVKSVVKITEVMINNFFILNSLNTRMAK
jgi:hypothetical protein